MTYALHPLCTLFPRMTGAEFASLRDDIAANGMRTPIVLHDGMILDGGNRYKACLEAGVEPVFTKFNGDNLVSFVWSVNGARRHMTPGQSAAIVASLQDWAKAQTVGNPAFKAQPGNVAGLATVADRAAQSGAGERTQRMADKVAKSDPALAQQVAHGEVSLPKALAQVEAKAHPKQPEPAPVPVVEPEPEPEYEGPSAEELAAAEAEQADEVAALQLLIGTDDKLGAAVAEVKRQAALIRILEERVRGLQNSNNEHIRLVKSWRAKYEKLAKVSA